MTEGNQGPVSFHKHQPHVCFAFVPRGRDQTARADSLLGLRRADRSAEADFLGMSLAAVWKLAHVPASFGALRPLVRGTGDNMRPHRFLFPQTACCTSASKQELASSVAQEAPMDGPNPAGLRPIGSSGVYVREGQTALDRWLWCSPDPAFGFLSLSTQVRAQSPLVPGIRDGRGRGHYARDLTSNKGPPPSSRVM